MTYHYQPSSFMLSTSHYDKAKADRAVTFIQNLCHTKGNGLGKNLCCCRGKNRLFEISLEL